MSNKGVKLTREEMIAHIPKEAKVRFHIGLERGSLKVELYVPRGEDLQKPHEQDECYIVTRGNGQFVMGEETVDFKPGDFLFVPAGIPHRFISDSRQFFPLAIYTSFKQIDKWYRRAFTPMVPLPVVSLP